MEQFKKEFIDFLFQSGSGRIGGDYKLKSQRESPHFFNIGDFNDGVSTTKLGAAYADALLHAIKGTQIGDLEDHMILYGIPEKGISLAIATSVALAGKGVNMPWFFTRKTAKTYGEASNLSREDKIKALVVGRAPRDGWGIIQLDDVFTAGDAKYEARKNLQELGNFQLPWLIIAVDRQEVGVDGTSAIEKYVQETGTQVASILTVTDVLEYLREKPGSDPRAIERMENYLRVYGTAAARKEILPLEQNVIGRDTSIIPACDMTDLAVFETIVRQTAKNDKVGGYKLSSHLALTHSLPKIVDVARNLTDKPLIYDHQKAGTDPPDFAKNFMGVMKHSGVDTVILFPQAGPETERAWIYRAIDAGLNVIVGGRMTHSAYTVSEGGFITDEGANEMYRIAARAGVNHFVVPGNKPAVIEQIKSMVEAEGVTPVFYSPGFVAQGGKIADAAKVAGDRWHAIVGRGITQAPNQDYEKAALELTKELP